MPYRWIWPPSKFGASDGGAVGVATLALQAAIMHESTAADLIGSPYPLPEECSSMARAPVSKTGGWGFESLHSCQAGIRH